MKSPAQRAFLYAKLDKKEPVTIEKPKPKKKGIHSVIDKTLTKKGKE